MVVLRQRIEPRFKKLSLSGQQGHALGVTPAAWLELPPGRREIVRVLQHNLISPVCIPIWLASRHERGVHHPLRHRFQLLFLCATFAPTAMRWRGLFPKESLCRVCGLATEEGLLSLEKGVLLATYFLSNHQEVTDCEVSSHKLLVQS